MADQNTYDVGDKPRLSANFKVGVADTDPTTLTYKALKPQGGTVTLVWNTDAALVKDSTGNFHVDQAIDQWGQWEYRFIGTGAAEASEAGSFYVRKPNIT